MKIRGALVVGLVWLAALTIGTVNTVNAEINLWEDKLTVTGFLRYYLGIHLGGKNPNNVGQDNFDLTLARSFFQTEWTFKPTSKIKFFSKVRFISDQTYHWDSNLRTYDAFPVDVQSSKWTMLKTDDDDYRLEVWELYSDISLGNLWLRLGKQQIVWGEMIQARLMDQINALDLSWNFMYEPEEFENIRIPNWSIRGIYSIDERIQWMNNVTIEGFINPGDVLPTQWAEPGAPFNVFGPLPPFFQVTTQDRMGRTEYGGRIGAMVGNLYFTLNYMHLFSDEPLLLKTKAILIPPVPPIFDLREEYPEIDIYGATANYYIGGRINTVITFEGTWVPNQPYTDATNVNPIPGAPGIRDQGTFRYAVKLNRMTFVLPAGSNAMDLTFQFLQTIREGDTDKLLGPNQTKVDTNDEMIVLQARQPLWHNNIEINTVYVYDLDGGYQFQPMFQYTYGDYWYFNVVGVFVGGSDDRSGRVGSMPWADNVTFRVTYQF